MKPTMIMLVGVVLLAAVFLAEIYVAAIVFLLSCLTLILILAGTLIPVPSRARHLVTPAAGPGSFFPEWPCLENTKLDPHRDNHLRFRIEVRAFGLLAMIGIGALYIMKLVVSLHGNPFRPYREILGSGEYALLYVLLFVSFIPVNMAAGWLSERIRLAWSGIALGSFDPHTGGYTFCDPHGAQHGGTRKAIPPRPHDNICVVFYGLKNPESNTSSTGLLFHRLRLQNSSTAGAD